MRANVARPLRNNATWSAPTRTDGAGPSSAAGAGGGTAEADTCAQPTTTAAAINAAIAHRQPGPRTVCKRDISRTHYHKNA